MDDFVAFYAASKDRALRTVIAVNRDDAQDAVAEAYARAFARWRRPCEHPDPVGWVLLTALNLRRRQWRRGRRESLGLVPEALEQVQGSSVGSLDAELRRAVLDLPRRQREVVALVATTGGVWSWQVAAAASASKACRCRVPPGVAAVEFRRPDHPHAAARDRSR